MTQTAVRPSAEPPVQDRLNKGAGFLPSSLSVAARIIRKFRRTPQLIVFTTIQSAVFLLMFRYSLGGAINVPGGQSYVNFLVPGFVTTAVLFAGMGAAVGVAEDQQNGFIDRLRSPAARQLASRARRRVRDGAPEPAADPIHRRKIVDAFLAASRNGDLDRLLAVLDSDVVLRADHAAVLSGAPAELRGAAAVAGAFSGRAQGTRLALLDGLAGAAFAPNGRTLGVFSFTIVGARIVDIEMVADPARLRRLDVTLLDA